jgi:hypothetical protein
MYVSCGIIHRRVAYMPAPVIDFESIPPSRQPINRTHHNLISIKRTNKQTPNTNKQVDYGISHSPIWKGEGAIDPTVHTTLVHNEQEKGGFDFAMVLLGSLFNLSYVILVNLVLTAIIAGAWFWLLWGVGWMEYMGVIALCTVGDFDMMGG